MTWQELRGIRVAPHFHMSEVIPAHKPHDLLINDLEILLLNYENLLGLLEHYRIKYKTPFIITSGLRTPSTNPGYKNSYHLFGMAVDFYPLNEKVYHELAADLYNTWPGGAGYYPQDGFLHVDIGFRRRWKRVNGKYLGW